VPVPADFSLTPEQHITAYLEAHVFLEEKAIKIHGTGTQRALAVGERFKFAIYVNQAYECQNSALRL
jgi:hypothetical protein